jgi:hypothetical protein
MSCHGLLHLFKDAGAIADSLTGIQEEWFLISALT